MSGTRTTAPPLISPDGRDLDWRTVVTVSAVTRAIGFTRRGTHYLLQRLGIRPTICELGGTTRRIAVLSLEQAAELSKRLAIERPGLVARATAATATVKSARARKCP